MKIILTCTFPSKQSANTAANLVKSSGYDIEKVTVFGKRNFGNIKNTDDFYERAYLPFTQNNYQTDSTRTDIDYPYSQIASVSAVLGFDNVINPFKEELPSEFSEYLNEGAYMRCTVSSHQLDAAKDILSENGGENIKTYMPS